MTKFISLRQFVVILIVVALFVSLALMCEDDDASFDLACNASAISVSSYRDLLGNLLYCSSVSYSNEHPASSKQFILFVSRQEKSPPEILS